MRGASFNAVSSESSYVGDRLSATLRLPVPERPNVTIVGQTLDNHTLLIGATSLLTMIVAMLVAWSAVRVRPLDVLRYE